MPRVSKRKQTVNHKNQTRNHKEVCKVGIYARLSSDQYVSVFKKSPKKESIDMQIDICRKYLSQQKEQGEKIEIFDTYCDIGKTGSNFNRDEFLRLLQDIRLGDVNCVIVKDLSRFGRNYLEAGNYIEKIFPFLGVRFIAVSDGFDTKAKGNDNKKLEMNIKNLVHDMYAKDFSNKAKIHLQKRRENGSFVGGSTPYGYTYEWIEKNKVLVPDADTKLIVQMIYDIFLKEGSYAAVTDLLNRKRINPPIIYKKTRHVFCPEDEIYKGWDTTSVTRILKNESYKGILAQGKTSITARDEKNRRQKDRSEWTMIENTHIPLIDKETFAKAQESIEKIHQKTISKKKEENQIPLEENVFDDVLYCGVCGKKMNRHSSMKLYENGSKKRLEFYNCMNCYLNKTDQKCKGNRINKEILSDILFSLLRVEFQLYLEKSKNFVELNQVLGEKKKKEYANVNRQITMQRERIEEEESDAYMFYRTGKITQDIYAERKLVCARKVEELEKRQKNMEENIKNLSLKLERQSKAVRRLLKLQDTKELTKGFVNTFMKKISIHSGKRVEIIYAFTNERMEKAL